MIAAIGKNRELGKDNKLLWHIGEDFKRFKYLTSGNVVIVGRKTFESIGKPLPNRTNIVITRNKSYHPDGVVVCYSIEEAIEFVKKNPFTSGKEVFIIGGAELYRQGIIFANKLYLTLINKEYPDADTFFPDYSEFKKISFEKECNKDGLFFKFINLAK